VVVVALVSSDAVESAELAQAANPIARVARVFNSELVDTEDRVSWIRSRLQITAPHHEHALKVGLGYRGRRVNPGDPDPTVVVDLGRVFPLDALFLVPAQREYLEDQGIFPKKFTIELSDDADFGRRTVLFSSGDSVFPQPDGRPVKFSAQDVEARYVRLTVHQGHHDRGWRDQFGLAELAVVSEWKVVSFGARVTVSGALDVPNIWFAGALTDGRMPQGIWQNGRNSPTRGDATIIKNGEKQVSWTIDLERDTPVDHMVIFPYQLTSAPESAMLPDELAVHFIREDGETPVHTWKSPLTGGSQMTPLVIPFHGQVARRVRVVATNPWQVGDLKVQALSEIEVWAGGANVAAGRSVIRRRAAVVETIDSLTDGFATDKKIINPALWLNQLHERGRLEKELAQLEPKRARMASESELNATWGSAMMLGLTFLIPVFIVERRRQKARQQIDTLRRRIASDLHDDIGSNLGSISLIARTARKDLVRLQGPEAVAEDLGEVESIARESSLAMRDIVWLLEKSQDSIGDLVERMRETGNRLLREVDYTLECESGRTASRLSLDAKRHLFLFYKEAIHNILKHSRANQVFIRLWDAGEKFAMEIRDNGIGLPCDADQKPVPVRKLTDRARVLDGELTIDSSKEVGTTIRLFVKRTHLNSNPAMS
jgi:signal transduction histidine kinase